MDKFARAAVGLSMWLATVLLVLGCWAFFERYSHPRVVPALVTAIALAALMLLWRRPATAPDSFSAKVLIVAVAAYVSLLLWSGDVEVEGEVRAFFFFCLAVGMVALCVAVARSSPPTRLLARLRGIAMVPAFADLFANYFRQHVVLVDGINLDFSVRMTVPIVGRLVALPDPWDDIVLIQATGAIIGIAAPCMVVLPVLYLILLWRQQRTREPGGVDADAGA